jgi:hypothetical protein
MFEVFTALKIQIASFWVVTPCSVVVRYRRFRGPCFLHLQGGSMDPLNYWYPTTLLQGVTVQKNSISISFMHHEMCSAIVYANDVNLLGHSINTIKENLETFLEASRDTDQEINAEKTKYIIMSRHQNSGQSQNRIV